MESYHQEVLNYLAYTEKKYNIQELHSLFSLPQKGVICLHFIEVHEPDEYCPYEVENITTTILNNYEIPLFTEEAENFINVDNGLALDSSGNIKSFKTIFKESFLSRHKKEKDDSIESDDKENSNEKVKITRHKFLEFISPKSITFSKLEILRSELTKAFEPLNTRLEALKFALSSNKEGKVGIAGASTIYRVKFLYLVKEMQKEIDNNLYFKQIANSGEETDVFTLYLCFCTVDDLLRLFMNVSHIPKVSIDYARDELKDKINLDSPTIFLYLKITKDE